MLSALDNCTTFDLGALSEVTKGDVPVFFNAGIAATENLGRIAIRFDSELPQPDAHAAWTSFFAGDFPLLSSENDWALLIPKELIIPPMEQLLNDEITKSGKFNLEGAPSGSWVPDGSVPKLEFTFSGEVIDACIGIDLDVDVTIAAHLSVPQTNVLRTTIEVEWDSNFWEELECEVVGALFWPIVGATMLADDKGLKPWQYLLLLLAWCYSPALVFIGTVVYASTDAPASQLPKIPAWKKISDTEMYQELPFPTDFGDFVSGLSLTAVSPVDAGLVMTGSLVVTEPIVPELQTFVTPFKGWVMDHACSDPSSFMNEAKIGLVANPMGPTPRLPLSVCMVKVIENPHDQFDDNNGWWDISVPMLSSLEFRINVSAEDIFHGPVEQFVQEGTKVDNKDQFGEVPVCRVLIISNNGTRLITIQKPPPVPKGPKTDNEWQQYMFWKASHCWKTTSIWGILGVFNPKWLVDPPPEAIFGQSWWVRATGLEQGASVMLRDNVGREVMTARAGPTGTVELSALFENAGPDTNLTVSRNGGVISAADFERRAESLPTPMSAPASELAIKQVLLVRVATVHVDALPVQMAMAYHKGGPALFVVSGIGVSVYNLDNLQRPERMLWLREAGVNGIDVRHPDLLTWGARGLKPLSTLATHKRTIECDSGSTVRDICNIGHLVYVLRQDGVHVLDSTLCEVGFMRLDDARKVAVVADRLVVGTAEGLSIFDLCNPKVPALAGAFPMSNVAAIGRAPAGGRRRAVFVQTRGRGGKVIDLTVPDRPEEIAEFAQRPWYIEGARLGRLFARLDENLRRISIYRMEGTNSGYERPPLASDIWEEASSAEGEFQNRLS